MAKVVTESPRRGHGAPSLKTARRLTKDEISSDMEDFDSGASRAPVSAHRQHGWDAKEFSDLLGPLRAYLRKQVGRPWNLVYSEMNESLDKRSISGQHIWDHVYWEVERYTQLGSDGKVYAKHVRFLKSYTPVTGLYVHPTTGLLCYKSDPRHVSRSTTRRYSFYKELKKFRLDEHLAPSKAMRRIEKHGSSSTRTLDLNDFIIVDDLHVLQRIAGVWMLHSYQELDPSAVIEVRRVGGPFLNSLMGREVEIKRGPGVLQKISTRQIGHRDKKLWALAHKAA
jgi:hypothetical protein